MNIKWFAANCLHNSSLVRVLPEWNMFLCNHSRIGRVSPFLNCVSNPGICSPAFAKNWAA